MEEEKKLLVFCLKGRVGRTYTGYLCVKELNIKLYFWHGKDWTMWLLLTYLTSSLRTLSHVVFDPETNNYSPFHEIVLTTFKAQKGTLLV